MLIGESRINNDNINIDSKKPQAGTGNTNASKNKTNDNNINIRTNGTRKDVGLGGKSNKKLEKPLSMIII